MTAEGIATSPLASILSLLLSVLVVVGFSAVVLTEVTLAEIVFALSLMIILVFPWMLFRYLLPLLPFTLFYVVMGVRSCHEWYRRWLRVPGPHAKWAASAVVIGCVVALNIYSNTTYILRKALSGAGGAS